MVRRIPGKLGEHMMAISQIEKVKITNKNRSVYLNNFAK
uniref:Uncharacterized protein n=1 Tax=Rhizophora mucronata TaxID=61149 RepID=A0A2P2NKG8_RHIMU